MKLLRRILIILAMCGCFIVAFTSIRHASDTSRATMLHAIDAPAELRTVTAVSGLVPGSFRGLLADMLFLRMTSLQQAGYYWEMNQLASWITTLQPRFGGASAFLAWNMAYNLSAAAITDTARYEWIEAAAAMLREEAIPANPVNPEPWFELGWIYYNKIGGASDRSHLFYKQTLANTLSSALTASDSPLRLSAFRLDPMRMQYSDSRYRPLDWRLPESLALYYAVDGLSCMPHGRNPSLERLKIMALMESARAGCIAWQSDTEMVVVPVPERVEPLLQEITTAIRTYADDTFWMFYHTALQDAMLIMASLDRAKAENYWREFNELFPDSDHPSTLDGFLEAMFAQPVEGLSRRQIQLQIHILIGLGRTDDARKRHAEWMRKTTENNLLSYNALPAFKHFLTQTRHPSKTREDKVPH